MYIYLFYSNRSTTLLALILFAYTNFSDNKTKQHQLLNRPCGETVSADLSKMKKETLNFWF